MTVAALEVVALDQLLAARAAGKQGQIIVLSCSAAQHRRDDRPYCSFLFTWHHVHPHPHSLTDTLHVLVQQQMRSDRSFSNPYPLVIHTLHPQSCVLPAGAAHAITGNKPAAAATQSDITPCGDQNLPDTTTTHNNTNTNNSPSSSSTAWLSGLHREFQRSVHPHIKAAWDLAVGSDLRYKGTTINEAFSSSAVERAAMAYV
jgi:hypothetical protein